MYTLETSEGTVGFKFGMATWYIFSQDSGLKLTELQESLANADLKTLIDIFDSAAKAYAIKKNKDYTFSKYDIADLIDDVSMETAAELLVQGMKSFGGEEIKKKTVNKK
ncbi:MAG: hypothetical protein ACC656_13925, partial [Candidatus Heimdallarchaeota archaeon]